MKLIDFVKQKATLHSVAKYNEENAQFKMPIYQSKQPGVYFILLGDDIMKVGKADGRNGLKGRLNDYRAKNVIRLPNDPTARLIHDIMTSELKDKTLEFYVYEIPMVESILEGYTIEMSRARSFEKILSKQAEDEGHSMLLSSQH